MKVIRRITLMSLLCIGVFSLVPNSANAALIEGLIFNGLKTILGVADKNAKNQVAVNVDAINRKTKQVVSGIEDLNTKTLSLGADIGRLWKVTNNFYNDLKKMSDTVKGYSEVLDLIGGTRDIYGYCGAATTIVAQKTPMLTLKQMEYVYGRCVHIQEVSLSRIRNLYALVTSNSVSMSDYERIQIMRQIADEQLATANEARALVADVKGMVLAYELKKEDDAFKKSFWNLRL